MHHLYGSASGIWPFQSGSNVIATLSSVNMTTHECSAVSDNIVANQLTLLVPLTGTFPDNGWADWNGALKATPVRRTVTIPHSLAGLYG